MKMMLNTWGESKKLRLLNLFNRGEIIQDIVDVFGCSRRSMYRILDELDAQGHTVNWRRNDPRGPRKEGNSVGAGEA
jgi:hypothetical protein